MAKANKTSNPDKLFEDVSLDKLCVQVKLSIKDPLRKSIKDLSGSKELAQAHSMSEGAVNVSIKLMPGDMIKGYTDSLSALRKYYTDNSMPIGSGKQTNRIIPKEDATEFYSEMKKLETQANDSAKLLLREWGTTAFRATLEKHMGKKFDETQYMKKEQLQKAMKTLVHVPAPQPYAVAEGIESGGAYLDPKTVASMKRQLNEDHAKIRQYANEHLWTELVGGLEEIAKVCSKEHGSGKGSIFRDTMVPKVKSMVEKFPKMNFDGDKRLNDVISSISDILTDVDNDTLRKNPEKRKEVASKSNEVLEAVSSYRPKKAKETETA